MSYFEKGSPERKLAIAHLTEQLVITSGIIRSAVIGSRLFREVRADFDLRFPEMVREAADQLALSYQAPLPKGDHRE